MYSEFIIKTTIFGKEKDMLKAREFSEKFGRIEMYASKG